MTNDTDHLQPLRDELAAYEARRAEHAAGSDYREGWTEGRRAARERYGDPSAVGRHATGTEQAAGYDDGYRCALLRERLRRLERSA